LLLKEKWANRIDSKRAGLILSPLLVVGRVSMVPRFFAREFIMTAAACASAWWYWDTFEEAPALA
jgi:hypothetical protein